MDVGRYLSRSQLGRLDRACISRSSANRAKCRTVALALYRFLPPEVQRKARAVLR